MNKNENYIIKNKTSIFSSKADFCLLCHCAFRYALGRQTYAPHVIQNFIKDNVKLLDDNTINLMIKEIEEKENYPCGLGNENIDKPDWLLFKQFLQTEKTRRDHNE